MDPSTVSDGLSLDHVVGTKDNGVKDTHARDGSDLRDRGTRPRDGARPEQLQECTAGVKMRLRHGWPEL